ncbi:MAG: glycosyltransferase [Burkholderiales bacterium]|nr:glycosyltransferase [Burkholderiales bacterium]
MPRDGTLLIWGTHYGLGGWLAASGCDRVVILNELFDCANLYRHLLEVRAAGLPEPTVLHVSQLIRQASGIDGPVLYPTSDPAPFLSIARDVQRAEIVIGRLSRDIADKHHRDDPRLYRALAAAGARVRLMGATVLAGALADRPDIELLPEGALPPHEFLAGLNVFWYRTAADGVYVEPSGVVVAEAMAAGLPVVAARPGGFEDLIVHGVTGFLVNDQDGAYEALLALTRDAALRRRMGAAGREEAVRRFGPAYADALRAVIDAAGPHERTGSS